MTKTSRFTLLLSFLALALQLKSQKIDELSLVNLSIDSTYDLRTCLQIIHPPYYKCFDQDTLRAGKQIDCCIQNQVQKEFRVYCIKCVNEKEFDTLKVIMIVEDTAFKFEIKKERKYILSRLGKNSKFYDFVKKFNKPIQAKKYDTDSLHQGKINFMTKETFDKGNKQFRFGKSDDQILLGFFNFSRLYIDNIKGLAMYKMTWLGGGLCGYDNLILLSRQNGLWKFEKKIELGVY